MNYTLFPAYDVFPQHTIADLISGITFIIRFQSGEAFTVEGNKHTHTHTHKRASKKNLGLAQIVYLIYKVN